MMDPFTTAYIALACAAVVGVAWVAAVAHFMKITGL